MNVSASQNQLQAIFSKLLRMRVVLFLLFALLVCGYTVWRAYSLANAPTPASAVSSKLQSVNNPHIDQATVSKINQLQDNSVNVRALFNQARQNPFQE